MFLLYLHGDEYSREAAAHMAIFIYCIPFFAKVFRIFVASRVMNFPWTRL